jgi:drug/metabolite transporter (DMT)-like permease
MFLLSVLIGVCAGVAVRFQRARSGKERSLANWLAFALNSLIIVGLAFLIGRHPDRQSMSEGWMLASAIGCFVSLLVVAFFPNRR